MVVALQPGSLSGCDEQSALLTLTGQTARTFVVLSHRDIGALCYYSITSLLLTDRTDKKPMPLDGSHGTPDVNWARGRPV